MFSHGLLYIWTELLHLTCPHEAVLLKFIYSEKAAKFCEIFPLILTVCTVVKSQVKISQNFVAFSEYITTTHVTTPFAKEDLKRAFFADFNFKTSLLKFIYFEKATKYLRNLHLTFDYSTYSQKLDEDFAKFCGLLRIYEL